MSYLDIGEVASKSGNTASALRHYERLGLISSVARCGLRRQFLPEVLLQLKLIAMGKLAGFSLHDIAGIFGNNHTLNLPREILHQKADELDQQIKELTELRNTLRHVADCPAPTHQECPAFQRLLNQAGKKTADGAVTRRKAIQSVRRRQYNEEQR